MNLGDEPPALVDLVTDEFEVTTEAASATVIDLAARGWLSIEELAPGAVHIRLGRRPPSAPLTPYEERVLDHIRALATDGVVPAQALTTGPEAVSTGWWRAFAGEVISDAQQRGLCRPRWPAGVKGLLGLLSTAAGAALAAAWYVADYEDDADTVVVLVVVSAFVALYCFGVVGPLLRSNDQRDLPAGLEMGSRWLGVRRFMDQHGDFKRYPAAAVAVWDRHLAYAAALDLAPLAVDQLPLGAEDPRHAYSRFGGEWRKVRVQYPWFRPGWGRQPAVAALIGLLVTAAAVTVAWFGLKVFNDESLRNEAPEADPVSSTAEPPDGLRWVGLGLTLAAVPVAAWWGANLVAGVSDAFARREVEGVVIRTRCRPRYSPLSRLRLTRIVGEKDSEPRWYVAVDDGSRDVIPAWSVRRPIYQMARQGARVRMTVTPRLGYVAELQVVRDALPTEPAVNAMEQAAVDLAAALEAAT